jgi:opacity protein-like surface antigen
MVHAGTAALAALLFYASSASVASIAFARDLLSSPPGEMSAHEFQRSISSQALTGWYVRADFAATQERLPQVSAANRVLLPAMKSSNGWLGSLGMGYQFTPWFRTDASVEFRNTRRTRHTSATFYCIGGVEGVDETVNGVTTPIGLRGLYSRCFSQSSADLKRLAALFNGYIDLGTWGGLTPYVGAGAGVSRGVFSAKSNWHTTNDGSEYAPEIIPTPGFPSRFVDSPPDLTDFSFGKQSKRVSVANDKINFTWALMAGIAYDIGPNSKIDIGYRFLNQGTFAPGAAARDQSVHELRVGLRYTVD